MTRKRKPSSPEKRAAIAQSMREYWSRQKKVRAWQPPAEFADMHRELLSKLGNKKEARRLVEDHARAVAARRSRVSKVAT